MISLFRVALTLILFAIGSEAMASGRVLPPAASTSHIASLMKTANDKGTVTVIVGFRVAFAAEGTLAAADARAQRSDIARAASSFQSRYAAAIARHPNAFRSYSSVPFAAIEVTPAELDALSRDPAVVSITPNRLYKTNLATSIPMVRADVAQGEGFTGKGQTVAIIDTGVDKNHPFLKDRVVAEACFSTGRWCPGGVTTLKGAGAGMPCMDGCDHGTHVAGIVAGSDATSKGVAPEATLMAIQVFGPDGAKTADINAGLDYVYSRRDDFSIAAVNMSLGTGASYAGTCAEEQPATEALIQNLRSAGIATIVAAGNEGSTYGLSAPACLPSAIAVGAVSSRDWGDCQGDPNLGPTSRDKVTCYSNTGSKLALLAPGSPIRSSVPGNRFEVYSGTSMAAPHVAGAFAALKQKKPDASVTEILNALDAAGPLITDYRTAQQTPRLDVKAGLDVLAANPTKLAYTMLGNGLGTVTFAAGTAAPATASNGRTSCAGSCVVIPPSQTLTLTAKPAAGSSFAGWAGACTGTSETCSVTLDQSKAVSATFSKPSFTLSYAKTGDGAGKVELLSDPLGSYAECESDCVRTYEKGSHVFAIPEPAEGSLFGGWSGACQGRSLCSVSMTSAKTLSASFIKQNGGEQVLTYNKIGPGGGSVVFEPIGDKSSCFGNCTTKYSAGTIVKVTAFPDEYSTFVSWSGACSKSGATCTVTMDTARAITANFVNSPVLTFTRAGSGTGTVSFSPEGSYGYCFANCESSFPPGTRVTLTPSPTHGSSFQGWGGACSGKGTCTILMNTARAVTATFAAPPPKLALTYQKTGPGNGTVSFTPAEANATCAANCVNSYVQGTRIRVRVAGIDQATVFAGWTGACRGKGTCVVKLRAAATVGAIFNLRPVYQLTYAKAGTGQGKVSFSPASPSSPGDCTTSCNKPFIERTRVTLQATANAGSVFSGWSGACKGKKTCVVSMTKARSVTATFTLTNPTSAALAQ